MTNKEKIINDIHFVLGNLHGISFLTGSPNMFDAIDCTKNLLEAILKEITNELKE